MEFTQELLGLPPWEAVIEMVNRHYTKAIDPQSATLVEVDPIAGNKMEVTLALRPSGTLRNLLPPTEQLTVVVERLDLQRFFNGPLNMAFSRTPKTTLEIVRRISQQTGIVFDQDDIIHEVVPVGAGNYLLKAHPRSIRWVGRLSITILT